MTAQMISMPPGGEECKTTSALILIFSPIFYPKVIRPLPICQEGGTALEVVACCCPPLPGKVMSLLFNMLSRLVITFLPRSKHLLILGLQSPSTVILEPPKIKSDTVSIISPSISHEVMGSDAMIFVF